MQGRQFAIAASNVREKIDGDLVEIRDYLESTGVGYRGSLVDSEGFPLPDIDHYKITGERKRAIRLLNDRKRIENVIDALTSSVMGDNPSISMELVTSAPYAIVHNVGENSPAERAGLIEGDFICSFGSARTLGMIPSIIVPQQILEISIIRIEDGAAVHHSLDLTPCEWEGNGLVGCLLLPVQ